MLPNTIVNVMVVSIGWIKNQVGPKIVCLYTATKSLRTKSINKSLNFQREERFRERIDFVGDIVKSQSPELSLLLLLDTNSLNFEMKFVQKQNTQR